MRSKGEQGSAKSSAARYIKVLIDPQIPPTREDDHSRGAPLFWPASERRGSRFPTEIVRFVRSSAYVSAPGLGSPAALLGTASPAPLRLTHARATSMTMVAPAAKRIAETGIRA